MNKGIAWFLRDFVAAAVILSIIYLGGAGGCGGGTANNETGQADSVPASNAALSGVQTGLASSVTSVFQTLSPALSSGSQGGLVLGGRHNKHEDAAADCTVDDPNNPQVITCTVPCEAGNGTATYTFTVTSDSMVTFESQYGDCVVSACGEDVVLNGGDSGSVELNADGSVSGNVTTGNCGSGGIDATGADGTVTNIDYTLNFSGGASGETLTGSFCINGTSQTISSADDLNTFDCQEGDAIDECGDSCQASCSSSGDPSCDASTCEDACGTCFDSCVAATGCDSAACLDDCDQECGGIGGVSNCPAGAPEGSFCGNAGPTLQVSTVAPVPTVLQTSIDFYSTIDGASGTANVTAGPTGATDDTVFTFTNPFPGDALVGAMATLPSSILLAPPSLAPALPMTATSLGGTVTPVPLASSDFGVWAITHEDIFSTGPSPVPLTTYSTYAGGALLTTLPITGTPTYTGEMAGVLADTPTGGSDDVSGHVSLAVSGGTISGSVTNICTASGPSTLVAFNSCTSGTPFADITLTGTISGNGFSGQATTASIAGATIQQMNGNFYGLTGDEIAGTFTISVPALGVPGPGLILIGSFGAKQ